VVANAEFKTNHID